MTALRRPLIEAPSITIQGAQPLARVFHRDTRGFLIETLRSDDTSVNGSRFQMSYSSLTRPGEFRDRDRWHVHRMQTDRFVVVLGEMILALLDDRTESPTFGRLELIRLLGSPFSLDSSSDPMPEQTYLVPIPPGVLHCIGNLSATAFLLQNYPTNLYDASDEGRIPFTERPIGEEKAPFSWADVEEPMSSREGPWPRS